MAPEKFVEQVVEHEPDIVGFSAFLTTTMPMFKANINALEKAGLRDKVIVMVGGAPVTQEYADAVGADAYAADASTAVRKAKDLIEFRGRRRSPRDSCGRRASARPGRGASVEVTPRGAAEPPGCCRRGRTSTSRRCPAPRRPAWCGRATASARPAAPIPHISARSIAGEPSWTICSARWPPRPGSTTCW